MRLRLLLVMPMIGLSTLTVPFKTQAAEAATPELLEACVAGDVTAFPNPFSDLDPDHWAYEAVIKLHYCGAYRGAIAPAVLLRQQSSLAD